MQAHQVFTFADEAEYKPCHLGVAFDEISNGKNQRPDKTDAFEVDVRHHLEPVRRVANVEEESVFLKVDIRDSRAAESRKSTGVGLAGNQP